MFFQTAFQKICEVLPINRSALGSLIKYGIVGASTFMLDYALNWFLIIVAGINYLLVGYIAAPIVLAFNFMMHRVWTFRGTGSNSGRTNAQAGRYLTLVVFNTVAGMVLMIIFYGVLELPLLWARIICVVIGMMWNYPVFRLWVYRH